MKKSTIMPPFTDHRLDHHGMFSTDDFLSFNTKSRVSTLMPTDVQSFSTPNILSELLDVTQQSTMKLHLRTIPTTQIDISNVAGCNADINTPSEDEEYCSPDAPAASQKETSTCQHQNAENSISPVSETIFNARTVIPTPGSKQNMLHLHPSTANRYLDEQTAMLYNSDDSTMLKSMLQLPISPPSDQNARNDEKVQTCLQAKAKVGSLYQQLREHENNQTSLTYRNINSPAEKRGPIPLRLRHISHEDNQKLHWYTQYEDNQMLNWYNPEEDNQTLNWYNPEEDNQMFNWYHLEEDNQMIKWYNPEEDNQTLNWYNPEEDNQTLNWYNPEEDNQMSNWQNQNEDNHILKWYTHNADGQTFNWITLSEDDQPLKWYIRNEDNQALNWYTYDKDNQTFNWFTHCEDDQAPNRYIHNEDGQIINWYIHEEDDQTLIWYTIFHDISRCQEDPVMRKSTDVLSKVYNQIQMKTDIQWDGGKNKKLFARNITSFRLF